MPSVKDILIEMKDMSELMVDLAYSAVLFNNRAAAEEVITLENKLNSMNYEIKKQSLVAARSLEDAEKLTTLLEIAEAAESIGNAAKDLADLTLKGFEPHPVFKMVMEESEKTIIRLNVDESSVLVNNSLGDLLLLNRTGMRIISIRRGDSWIYGPDKNTVIIAGDVLIAKGSEAGTEIIEKLAEGEMDLEDLVNMEDFIDDN
ncbi:TrkA domain-containing protein [Methanobrevibacter ruminantium M1]|uniref:TrkA domain-containing protein n=1 Tax=Methanobrevibacter ruminantium (strain ATCC 35063 / DSM 1093 / JCM 13430 / OCM 146 / M1) TaxID=634498 RepID=D3E1H4_METRM|nr:potassium channel family protein [Methanobrevibacter ruminantium]ADC48059.1 TrkA domain-containing protein [Methanobrevibacter ruminantium M1]